MAFQVEFDRTNSETASDAKGGVACPFPKPETLLPQCGKMSNPSLESRPAKGRLPNAKMTMA
jgi:hypothetical protein